MTKSRPTKLHYMAGISRPHGEYFPGVPMRDLEADDIEALTDEQMADAMATSPGYSGPLYQVTKPAAKSEAPPKKTASSPKKAASTRPTPTKPTSAAPVEPDPVPPDAPEAAPSDQTGAAGEQE
jgi:hypothetical protein